jgi:ribose transport system permease protein
LFGASIFGRRVLALGVGPAVARYSGLPVRRDVAAVMVNAALLAGVAGIILSSSVRSYAPLSGNAYLLDAIGATFLGTTFSAHGRANVAGTLLGVLLLSIVKNGLLLVGVSFYWQQVGDGALIFLVLALSFRSRRSQ